MPGSYPLLVSREYLGRVAGVSVSKGTVSKMLGRPGWSRKRSVDAQERVTRTLFSA